MIFVVVDCGRRMRRLGLAREVPAHAAMMSLAPPAAIRADDLAGRELFAGLHALAVARVACAEDDARALVATTLRALEYPLPGEGEPCCEAAAWLRDAWRSTLHRWVSEEYGSCAAFIGPPEPESERARAYCPRCHQQFYRAQAECPDCAGIALEPFAAPRE